MTASETPDAVQPVIPEQAVEAAALALAAGFADDPDPIKDARTALNAAYPVLRSVTEAELREQIASEIEAQSIAYRELRAGRTITGYCEFDQGILAAAGVARGSGATRKEQRQ